MMKNMAPTGGMLILGEGLKVGGGFTDQCCALERARKGSSCSGQECGDLKWPAMRSEWIWIRGWQES